MIFLSVGSQMPFDRLVKAVDCWSGQRNRNDIFGQIGRGKFRPSIIQWERFLDPSKFHGLFRAARAIVSHAGTGCVLTALQYGKPILVLPRQATLGETTSEHQLHFVERLQEFKSIAVAVDERDLWAKLDVLDEMIGQKTIDSCASKDLVNSLRAFLDTKYRHPSASTSQV
jgi:UDP-N-acetylglucosamine transferase subunit ALG13